jgi:hypothetical protein
MLRLVLQAAALLDVSVLRNGRPFRNGVTLKPKTYYKITTVPACVLVESVWLARA